MFNLLFFNLAFILYLISAIIYLLGLTKERLSNYGYLMTILSFIIHTCSIVIRGFEASHLPMVGLFESMSFFAWMVVLIFCFIEYRYKLKVLGSFVLPLTCVILLSGYFFPKEIIPLVPALQSYWLGIHVSLSLFSYGAFVCGFEFGLMYLIQDKALRLKKESAYLPLPALEISDNLSYKSISIGFLFLTSGIITGAMWANSSWGAYWSWDPKETWSLITCLSTPLIFMLDF